MNLFYKKIFISLLILTNSSVLWQGKKQFIQAAEPKKYKIEDLSKPYTINKIYPSMFGPFDIHPVTLLESDKPELLWITGVHQNITEADGKTIRSAENFCHGHFSISYEKHEWQHRKNMLGGATQNRTMLLSLGQGLQSIVLPENFGIPVLSNEPFRVKSMVLNLNDIEDPYDIHVKTSIEFVRNTEVTLPFKPLFRKIIAVYVPAPPPNQENVPGEFISELNTTPKLDGKQKYSEYAKSASSFVQYTREDGLVASYHFFVPPGRHIYRHPLRKGVQDFPFDTTAHYISIHMHPYSESLTMIDRTTNKIIFKSTVKNFPDKRGIINLEHISSQEGIPVYKDHDYELIAIINNTTNEDVDTMAVMSFYLHDKQFDISKVKLE